VRLKTSVILYIYTHIDCKFILYTYFKSKVTVVQNSFLFANNLFLFNISNVLTRMPNSLCHEQPSCTVAKVIEIEADMTRNLSIRLHRIEYREPIEIHSMANISTCRNICCGIQNL